MHVPTLIRACGLKAVDKESESDILVTTSKFHICRNRPNIGGTWRLLSNPWNWLGSEGVHSWDWLCVFFTCGKESNLRRPSN